MPQSWVENDYVIRVFDHPDAIGPDAWRGLWAAEVQQGREPNPFVDPRYWAALHDSGSATPDTGWTLQLVTAWSPQDESLCAASAMYIKTHSRGEYVFDWAWADAYARHGLAYYPKALVAVPFTPVPGPRLLARDATARQALVQALLRWCETHGMSSLHLLFADDTDLAAAQAAGLMLRHTVQFHWHNHRPPLSPNTAPGCAAGEDRHNGKPFQDFDDFLASLNQDKRKKIRQERRKVAQAGVWFRAIRGTEIEAADWDFFYRCYERTYLEHGTPPYLTRAFFAALARLQPQNWLLFVAHRSDGQAIASSLIALQDHSMSDGSHIDNQTVGGVAYGRYWGALERIDCLHFEACYYQPIEWCIANGIRRFEGGAQGEHKMARALLPVRTSSAHWLAHPAFAEAVGHYLQREGTGVDAYLEHLASRSPLRQPLP